MIRLAIYYTPSPDSDLGQCAAGWLGRDAFSDVLYPLKPVRGMNKTRLWELTKAPRHYGFHATLKPPFRLAPGYTTRQVSQRLEEFAAKVHSFTLPPLKIRLLDDFFCLVSTAPCPELQQLAGDTVEFFDGFRTPATKQELARRRSRGLTERQEEMLLRWGYPYVMEEFRFHFTLTGRVKSDREKELLRQALNERFGPSLSQPQRVDTLSIFLELNGSAMRVHHSCPLPENCSEHAHKSLTKPEHSGIVKENLSRLCEGQVRPLFEGG